MYQPNEESSAAENQFQQYQCFIQGVCDSTGVTAVQLLQILRTVSDDEVVLPDGGAARQAHAIAQTSNRAEQTAQRAAIVTACHGLGMKPSIMADMAQRVVMMATIASFLDDRATFLPGRALPQTQPQPLEPGSSYMAAHWPEIHEWLTFPRGIGVWCAVLIAAFAAQPLPAVVVGVLFCGLMNALAIPLWEAGHEEGGRRRVHGDARWWWKSSRPLRMVVAHWGFRWLGVAVCLLAAWAGGTTFDGWWLPLALLLIYDVVRTLQTAENGPCAQ